MRAGTSCQHCLVRIYSNWIPKATDDPAKADEAVRKMRAVMEKKFSLEADENIYSDIAIDFTKILEEAAGGKDVFGEAKEKADEAAREVVKRLPEKMDLQEAMRVAVAGNAFDAGHMPVERMAEIADEILGEKLDVDERGEAEKLIGNYDKILFVGDNVGEPYFDRLLVERLAEMGKKIRYVVRARPLINDAEEKHARAAGIDEFAEIVKYDGYGYKAPVHGSQPQSSHGSRTGEQAKPEKGELLVGKGQAAFVTTTAFRPEAIYLLRVKCIRIADILKTRVGANVVKVWKGWQA